MAKYRHRIFELFEYRAEAADAITPRSSRPPTETTPPESWDFHHLAVSRSGSVVLVEFKSAEFSDEDTLADLRGDVATLASKLGRDSKVLFDFTGVEAFGPAQIAALVLFNQQLQSKGSRMALCCLAPAVRESFFAAAQSDGQD